MKEKCFNCSLHKIIRAVLFSVRNRSHSYLPWHLNSWVKPWCKVFFWKMAKKKSRVVRNKDGILKLKEMFELYFHSFLGFHISMALPSPRSRCISFSSQRCDTYRAFWTNRRETRRRRRERIRAARWRREILETAETPHVTDIQFRLLYLTFFLSIRHDSHSIATAKVQFDVRITVFARLNEIVIRESK